MKDIENKLFFILRIVVGASAGWAIGEAMFGQPSNVECRCSAHLR